MRKRLIFLLLMQFVSVSLFAQTNFDIGSDDGGEVISSNSNELVIGAINFNFKLVLKQAKHGNAEAQLNVGECYYYGEGISQDYSEAFKWYMKAAEQGLDRAQYSVGNCYYDGKGVSQDYLKAFEWYMKAAEQGLDRAQYSVGNCYYDGKGVSQDYLEAVEWNMKAAEQGHFFAQLSNGLYYCSVGDCYYKGDGVSQDYLKAFEWYMKAAEQGNVLAQYNLGSLYKEQNNYSEAVKWFLKAADNGYSKAKTGLNNMLNDNDYAKQVKKWTAYETIGGNAEIADGGKDGETQSANEDNSEVTFIQSDVDINIPELDLKNDRTFAVIIANESYNKEANVPYAMNDGNVFSEYCSNTLGLPSSNIHLVKNATLNDIRHEVNWVTNVMDASGGDAKVVFYYAGHGIPDERTRTAYLLPVDGYGSDVTTGYSLADLYSALGNSPSQSVTVFLDACFSGTKRDGDMLASARGVAIKVAETNPVGNMVVFSASQGDETAYPYAEKSHGMFTYYLLKKLQDTKGEVTLGELSDYVIQQVKLQSVVTNSNPQTPIIDTAPNMSSSWRSVTLR